MPRSISEDFLIQLHKRTGDDMGTKLAKLCVQANLPLSYVCRAVGVTRVTVHNWFRGAPVGTRSKASVQKFMDTVEEDLERGKLPVKDLFGAKTYVNHLIGTPDG